MKNYELIAELSKFPAGVEIVCSGCETLDNIVSCEQIGEDDMGNKEYSILRDLKDVELEGKHIFLQW